MNRCTCGHIKTQHNEAGKCLVCSCIDMNLVETPLDAVGLESPHDLLAGVDTTPESH